TREELDSEIERAVAGYSELDGVDASLAERLVGEGFLTYDELSVIEPDAMMSMGNLTEEQVQHIVDQAEQRAEAAEAAAAMERRRQREQERIDAATVEADQKEAELQASRGLAGVTLPPETADSGAKTPGGDETSANGAHSAEGAEKATTGGDSAEGSN
ncbi:MAG TPA: transcription termination factor NusA, partial [Pirellulales bacterium]